MLKKKEYRKGWKKTPIKVYINQQQGAGGTVGRDPEQVEKEPGGEDGGGSPGSGGGLRVWEDQAHQQAHQQRLHRGKL